VYFQLHLANSRRLKPAAIKSWGLFYCCYKKSLYKVEFMLKKYCLKSNRYKLVDELFNGFLFM